MNKSKDKTRLFSALFIILVCGVGSASAAVLTFRFTGTVTFVGGTPFGLSPSVGQQVQGSFTYDTSLPPAFDTGTLAGYIQPPPSGMSVVISGVTFRSQGDASLQVINSPGFDNFNGFFIPISAGGVLQPSPSNMVIYLGDFSGTALSSTALPLSFNAASFSLRIGDVFDASASGGIVSFSIDSLTAMFAGTPGFSNCDGQSVAALAQQYGGLDAASKALGYTSVQALQDAIRAFCRA